MVQVVWSDRDDHLHALSAKCNDGNYETPFFSSLPRTIIHCRMLWEKAGRPEKVRKNPRKTLDVEEEAMRKKWEVNINLELFRSPVSVSYVACCPFVPFLL